MWWKRLRFPNFFVAAGVLNLLTVISILVLKGFLPPVVPLMYGRPAGAEQLTQTLFLLIVPGVSLLLSGVNVFISSSSKDDFIKKFLAVASLAVSAMATITITKIILLVGFF